jgi:hypothetical protein
LPALESKDITWQLSSFYHLTTIECDKLRYFR